MRSHNIGDWAAKSWGLSRTPDVAQYREWEGHLKTTHLDCVWGGEEAAEGLRSPSWDRGCAAHQAGACRSLLSLCISQHAYACARACACTAGQWTQTPGLDSQASRLLEPYIGSRPSRRRRRRRTRRHARAPGWLEPASAADALQARQGVRLLRALSGKRQEVAST